MKKLIILFSCILAVTLAMFTPWVGSILAKEDVAFAANSQPNDKNGVKLGQFSSRSAYLVDYDTGTVLYERNAEAKHPIASMVKIMTLNIVFDEIRKGNLAFDEKIVISEVASGMGGSQMFLDTGLEYSVSDLIKGVTVVSANDASVALAERVSGSVDAFIDLMNDKAREYGMQNTNFVNVTGLPQDGQFSTAKDVTIMMRNLLNNREYYKFSTIYMENYTHPDGRITELVNTNKLIKFYNGCDAGKTGFTNDAMFCLSASAVKGDTRVIATVLGAENSKSRFNEISTMFNYAFANYETVKVFEKDKPFESQIKISKSKSEIVKLMVDKNLTVLNKRGFKINAEPKVSLNENLVAPIKAGTVIGKIELTDTSNGQIINSANLIVATDVQAKNFRDGLQSIADEWFLRYNFSK